MTRAYFVAGTDTGVGKTHVSCSLLASALAAGYRTAALKPVAAGAEASSEGLRNEDALALQQFCSPALAYAQINPVCLKAAIAPHVAAAQEGQSLSVASLLPACQSLLATQADLTLVEGAGGWLVPLNERETLADLASALQLPVILVVGLRLGCINHALLSVQAIAHSGLPLAGWVANCVDPHMDAREDSIATLTSAIDAPLLGVLPYQPERQPGAAPQLALRALLP